MKRTLADLSIRVVGKPARPADVARLMHGRPCDDDLGPARSRDAVSAGRRTLQRAGRVQRRPGAVARRGSARRCPRAHVILASGQRADPATATDFSLDEFMPAANLLRAGGLDSSRCRRIRGPSRPRESLLPGPAHLLDNPAPRRVTPVHCRAMLARGHATTHLLHARMESA